MQLRIEDDRIRLECSEDSYYTDFWKQLYVELRNRRVQATSETGRFYCHTEIP